MGNCWVVRFSGSGTLGNTIEKNIIFQGALWYRRKYSAAHDGVKVEGILTCGAKVFFFAGVDQVLK